MAINQRVFDTAIQSRTICSRAIGQNQSNGNNQYFLIDPDGTLYSEVLLAFNKAMLKTSTDNGFTWTNQVLSYPASRVSGTAEGPCIAVFVDGTNYYFLYCSANSIWYSIGDTLDSWYGEVSVKYGTFTDQVNQNFFASTGDADNLVYMGYFNATMTLKMIGLDLGRDINNVIQDFAGYSGVASSPMVSGVLALKSKDAIVYTVAAKTVPPDTLVYIPYTKKQGNGTGSFGTSVQIASGTLTAAPSGACSFKDVAIDVDASKNIGITYSISNPVTAISGYYAMSNDAGATWKSVYNAPPNGYSGYVDYMTGKLSTCNDIIGGYSGSFLLSSVYMQNGSGSLFVKEVPSIVVEPTGVAGLRTSINPWIKVNSVNDKVLGGKFFKYMNEKVPNFGDKSAIRIAYQVGEVNHKDGQDTVYSRVYHERLSNLAYPLQYSGTAFTKDNIDYYASGYIDVNTQLYIDKITDLGMTYSFSRYDPVQTSQITGRGSYGSPTTFESEACVDPGSYGFATVARNNADFSEYMERDTRKIFYKPNLYLSREFILNDGGYLKRTIWTIRIMGNDYELAQIVPRFLDGKIIYYEANLYVVGPSNDPFSKVILPSET